MNNDRSELYLAALNTLLPVLAKGMIAHGVTLRTAQDALKRALLDAAIAQTGGRASDSRISLITGLHRKDVKHLRETPVAQMETVQNPVARVINLWRGKTTRTLSRKDFEQLAKSARVDMAAGTLLAQMRRLGVVEGDDPLTLNADALIAPQGSAEIYQAYAKNLSAHAQAATDNLDGGPAEFERAAHFSHLSPGSLAELETLAATLAQQALDQFAKRATELQNRDRSGDGGSHRIAFGAYVHKKDSNE